MLHRPSRRVAHHEQEGPRVVSLGADQADALLTGTIGGQVHGDELPFDVAGVDG